MTRRGFERLGILSKTLLVNSCLEGAVPLTLGPWTWGGTSCTTAGINCRSWRSCPCVFAQLLVCEEEQSAIKANTTLYTSLRTRHYLHVITKCLASARTRPVLTVFSFTALIYIFNPVFIDWYLSPPHTRAICLRQSSFVELALRKILPCARNFW